MAVIKLTYIELTEEDFVKHYPLLPNHLNLTAGWALGKEGGCLFEPYGEEFELVIRFNPARVWTVIDDDDGDMSVVSGLHYVNRVGYLLSRHPVPANTVIEVRMTMSQRKDQALL